MMKKIMIVYPGHIISTIDVAKGYYYALRDAGFEVGEFNYHTKLAYHTEALETFQKANPTFKRRDGDFMILASEDILTEVVAFEPDVILNIHGMGMHKRGYWLIDRLRRNWSKPMALITLLTESPYADDIQWEAVATSGVDAATTNDLTSVDFLKMQVDDYMFGPRNPEYPRPAPADRKDIPLVYLPHAYRPEIHKPVPPSDLEEGFCWDVFFFGTLWPERLELFAKLQGLQDEYRCFIGGINTADASRAYMPIPNETLAYYYSGSKININHNRTAVGVDHSDIADREVHLTPGEAYSLGPRAYEIAACGGFQLCDDQRAELVDVFGESVPIYTDAQDLADKIEYFLNHENERIELAEESRLRVQNCSFENRTRRILIPFITEVYDGCSQTRH